MRLTATLGGARSSVTTSFVAALCALLWYGLFLALIALFPPAPGRASPLTGRAGVVILLAAFVILLALFTAFIAGLIAIVSLLRHRGGRLESGLVFSGLLIGGVMAGAHWWSSPRKEEFRAKVPIVRGSPHGRFAEYRGPQLMIAGTYESGRREGVWTMWDANGTKIRETSYKNGLKDGPASGWGTSFSRDQSARGKLLYQGRFSADRLVLLC